MSESRLPIAFDMTFPNRNQAGSGGYARSLLNAVSARDDVAAVALSGPAKSGLTGTLGWMVRGAGAAVRSSRAKVLHCPAFVAPWNVPAPLIISVLDVATRRFPQDYPLEWRLYENRVLPGQARKAALIVAISENTRRDVIDEYRIAPDRVVTIHPGVDPAFAAGPPAPAHEREPTIVFPGAPIARKNLDVVLRALESAPNDSPARRLTLLISGATAGQFPHHAERIASLGLERRVRWLGQVTRDSLRATIASASAVVYPSFYEGFGFPPLEAMAAGTPVVASNTSCLPEVLGDAALLVDPHDEAAVLRALDELLTVPSTTERLISAGRERAATFTWERCAEETVKVYRQVLRGAA